MDADLDITQMDADEIAEKHTLNHPNRHSGLDPESHEPTRWILNQVQDDDQNVFQRSTDLT